MRQRIVRGSLFTTPYETGPVYCMALAIPDADGNFEGYDSDGILVQFNAVQIRTVLRDGDAGVLTPRS